MNQSDLANIQRSGQILAQTARVCMMHIRRGSTPHALDSIIHKSIISADATPSFLGFESYKYSSCISVNNILVHGLPTTVPFNNGDIVSIDLGVQYKGWHTDGAFTTIIGSAPTHIHSALRATRKALYDGIAQCFPGKRIGDISHAIQKVGDDNFLCIIKELTGHGIGRNLHEPPNIPNIGSQGTGPVLKQGMIVAIEPMFALPASRASSHRFTCPIATSRDGWSIELAPSLIGVHFEHTIIITDSKPIIVTRCVDSKDNVW